MSKNMERSFERQFNYAQVDKWSDNYVDYAQIKNQIKTAQQQIAEAQVNHEDTKTIKEESRQLFVKQVAKGNDAFTNFFAEKYSDISENASAISDEMNAYLNENRRNSGDAAQTEQIRKRITGEYLDAYQLGIFLRTNTEALEKLMNNYIQKCDNTNPPEEVKSFIDQAYEREMILEELLDNLQQLYVVLNREYSSAKDWRSRADIIEDLDSFIDPNLRLVFKGIRSDYKPFFDRYNEFYSQKSTIKWIPLIASYILLLPFVFKVFFNFAGFSEEDNFRSQKIFGILLMCICQWAFQAVPLYITALHAPLFVIILRCVPLIGNLAQSADAVMKNMFSQIMFVIIGGMVMGQAINETNIQQYCAYYLFKATIKKKRLFVLAIMLITAFFSMWISNCGTTAVMIDFATPILRQLPTESNFAKSILLAILIGGNYGGFLCSLAETHHPLAMQAVSTVQGVTGIGGTFGIVQYMAVGVPFGIVALIVMWAILMLLLPPDVDSIPRMPAKELEFGRRQAVAAIGCILTVVVWCVNYFYRWFGNPGIIGLLPVLVFYATGVVPAERVFNLPWGILVMVMGGNSLLCAMRDSRFLDIAGSALNSFLSNVDTWVVCLTVDAIGVALTFIVPQTVAVMIFLPIVARFASYEHRMFLVAMQAVSAITATMVLPNQTISNQVVAGCIDNHRNPYIPAKELIKWGGIATAVAIILLLTLQYGISLAYFP